MRQVRTLLQQRLCRTVPLEAIGDMTVASLRALAEEAGQGKHAAFLRLPLAAQGSMRSLQKSSHCSRVFRGTQCSCIMCCTGGGVRAAEQSSSGPPEPEAAAASSRDAVVTPTVAETAQVWLQPWSLTAP
jgi:hypothetical protein